MDAVRGLLGARLARYERHAAVTSQPRIRPDTQPREIAHVFNDFQHKVNSLLNSRAVPRELASTPASTSESASCRMLK